MELYDKHFSIVWNCMISILFQPGRLAKCQFSVDFVGKFFNLSKLVTVDPPLVCLIEI